MKLLFATRAVQKKTIKLETENIKRIIIATLTEDLDNNNNNNNNNNT